MKNGLEVFSLSTILENVQKNISSQLCEILPKKMGKRKEKNPLQSLLGLNGNMVNENLT